jgi:hypothetical protein
MISKSLRAVICANLPPAVERASAASKVDKPGSKSGERKVVKDQFLVLQAVKELP